MTIMGVREENTLGNIQGAGSRKELLFLTLLFSGRGFLRAAAKALLEELITVAVDI